MELMNEPLEQRYYPRCSAAAENIAEHIRMYYPYPRERNTGDRTALELCIFGKGQLPLMEELLMGNSSVVQLSGPPMDDVWEDLTVPLAVSGVGFEPFTIHIEKTNVQQGYHRAVEQELVAQLRNIFRQIFGLQM